MRTAAALLFLATVSGAAEPRVPEGFHIQLFARDLHHPRMLLSLDDGTLLVSRPDLNDVVALRDRDGDGVADTIRTAVSGVERAHGLAMRGRTLYVAGVKKIVAAERLPDGTFGAPREVIANLPDGGQHPHRTIAFGPDGRLYVSVGSSCNDCLESHPEHATLLQADADGMNRRVYARGLRSMIGFDWHPETGELWGSDAGSERRGGALPPEELNRIGDGLHYGWPLCFGKAVEDATHANPDGMSRAKFCGVSEASALELPAQSAPAAFVFYRGEQFPPEFRGDAFSVWSGSPAVKETKVVRIRYRDGRPAAVEDFLTAAAGRLSGASVGRDGALYVSDAANGVVYRVTHGAAVPVAMTSSAEETPPAPVLARAFRVDALRAPHSVVHDAEQDVYFVTNLDGPPAAKDANGFVARIDPEGNVDELRFIDALDAPKGLAIRGTELWVADIDRVRVFDRVTGNALRTIDLAPHGAVSLAGIVLGPDEAIYVTDTDVRVKGARERVREGHGRIYRIEADGDVEVASRGEELRSPSGIAWDGTRYLVAQSYGNEVLAWSPGAAAKAAMRGPGDFGGLVVLPTGAVIVTSGHDDGLHVAWGSGELRPLFARRPTAGGIGFDKKRNRLLIPSPGGDWLEAWTLPPLGAPADGGGGKTPKIAAAP